MLEMLSGSQFWMDVFKIILIDLLLSGDNAVVIALACRNLPADQRKKGILFGVGGAIGLRILLTFFAVNLLALPYLKLIGALLLLWIGVKLILPEKEHSANSILADTRLFGAIKTILIADFVMSLDNVLGVAAAAKGNVFLLVFGLLISIPLIAWSSQLVLRVIERFPVIIYGGGALLGYVAGEMIIGEAFIEPLLITRQYLHWMFPGFTAMLVLSIGIAISRRMTTEVGVVHLVDQVVQVQGSGSHGKQHVSNDANKQAERK